MNNEFEPPVEYMGFMIEFVPGGLFQQSHYIVYDEIGTLAGSNGPIRFASVDDAKVEINELTGLKHIFWRSDKR